MIVIQKFGGSILSNVDDIVKLGNKILDNYEENNKYIIVLSAYKNKTNELIKEFDKVTNKKNHFYSRFITFGEESTSLLLSAFLDKFFNVSYLDPYKLNLICSDNYLDADILSIDLDILKKELQENDILIIPGFIGINSSKEIVTLGRNGSDTTAAFLYQECLKITTTKCILYKDTSLSQLDPKIKDSKQHQYISYEQIGLLNSLGNNIISNKAIKIIKEHNLPLLLKNYFNDEETLISNKKSNLELLAVIPKKYFEIRISNIKNPKLINYLKKIYIKKLTIESNEIKILTEKLINHHLEIILLIDPNISINYKPVLLTQYIYDNKILTRKDDLIDLKS